MQEGFTLALDSDPRIWALRKLMEFLVNRV